MNCTFFVIVGCLHELRINRIILVPVRISLFLSAGKDDCHRDFPAGPSVHQADGIRAGGVCGISDPSPLQVQLPPLATGKCPRTEAFPADGQSGSYPDHEEAHRTTVRGVVQVSCGGFNGVLRG